MAVSKKFRWTNADGESVEVDIGAESENVTVEGIPLDEVLDSKADKQNAAYGFSGGGNSSAASGGAVGSETNTNDGFAGGYAAASTSGGAAGYQASATTGFAGGQNSKSTDGGGAAGRHSTAASGGAVGSEANAKNGFAGGQNAKSTGQGAAVGALASAYHGGAVGSGATAQNGFAGGANAKCTENTDCIQLGEGTNSNEKTFQVYDYQMMDAAGKVPLERLTTVNGGFAGGNNAISKNGGAVGSEATTEYGGAVGLDAHSNDGFAGGDSATATSGGTIGSGSGTEEGGSAGYYASSKKGGAVGSEAKTSDGFAGGKNAKCVDSDDNGIDAIQLGTGTNSTSKTLQVYDYQMMDISGKIPAERLPESLQSLAEYSLTPVQVGTWIDSTPVWRVAIPMTSVSEISLNTNNKSWSIRSDQILDRLSIINDTSNFIHIDSMIRFQNSNDYDPEAFATGWTEMFPGYFNGEAENVDYATHFYGWIEFALPASSVSAV